jgi:hypothetical protein
MPKESVTYSLGGLALVDLVERDYSLFSSVFGDIKGTKEFRNIAKFLVYNRLTYSVSIHQMLDVYSKELMEELGMKSMPSERSIYRSLEKIGRLFPVLLERYQNFLRDHNLWDNEQFIDFSASYFVGNRSDIGAFGYSKDHRPDKMQVSFGISTGMNDIPAALTIQRGNESDKKHLMEVINVVKKVIPENSALIFDSGGNTEKNKEKIRSLNYHYLTLKPKKVRSYKKSISYFSDEYKKRNIQVVKIGETEYFCAKKPENDGIYYIYFSRELYGTQIRSKSDRFERDRKKGEKILRKRKRERYPSEDGWIELIPELQRTISEIDNPYITGIEGFFILESSIDADPGSILRLYKDRDKAEKFIRSLKEGLEIRPIRHWNGYSIKGLFFITFLTDFIINLTHFLGSGNGMESPHKPEEEECLEKDDPHKNDEKFDIHFEERKRKGIVNVKLLKKYLISCSKTVVYPRSNFRFHIISNITPQITDLFGDFIKRYEDKTLNLRW